MRGGEPALPTPILDPSSLILGKCLCGVAVARRSVNDRKTIQLGLGRVRVFVPGVDGRFKLNVSCVRQRSDDGVVRKPTTPVLVRAPRSECLWSECRDPSRADASRSDQGVPEPTISSPAHGGLTGGSDCLHRRVIQKATGDSVGEPLAQRPRSVLRRSLTGHPGTTAATFRTRTGRGMNRSSRQVTRYVRSRQFVRWSSVEGGGPCESSVAVWSAWRLVGPSGAEPGAGDPTVTSPAGCDARTRPLTRVSHEKRNADQCPPTRGEPDRHR